MYALSRERIFLRRNESGWRISGRARAPFLRRAPCVRALILTNKYGIFEKFSHNLKLKKKCQIRNRLEIFLMLITAKMLMEI